MPVLSQRHWWSFPATCSADRPAAGTPSGRQEIEVSESEAGQRLDTVLSQRITSLSRSLISRAIHDELVTVNQQLRKSSYRVHAGDVLYLHGLPDPPSGPLPEEVPLDVLWEDDHLAVINKPIGMVVHPAKGHWSGTLASAAMHWFGALSDLNGRERPGIVHRLDRDTSGVILIAKTNAAHGSLAAQFAERTVQKRYVALVHGDPDRDRDWIDREVGPHPRQRAKMQVRPGHRLSKSARTFYEVAERFAGFAQVNVAPSTGRTHQIRVHLTHEGHPILCDALYGLETELTRAQLLSGREFPKGSEDGVPVLGRVALHAESLTFRHPQTDEPTTVTADLPNDMLQTIAILRQRSTLRRK